MVINDLVSKLTVYGLAVVTITTSSAAGYKLVTYHPATNSTSIIEQSLNGGQNDQDELIDPTNDSETPFSDLSSVTPTPQAGSKNLTAMVFPTLKPVPTISGQISSTNNLASASSTATCIITLWGQQYNVTNLRNTHSGGNIFNCGADMSSSYQGQHGTNLSRMQTYKVTSTTSSATANPTPVPSNQTPTATPVPQPGNNSCLITLWGLQYNVTNLRNTHSGGNIFNCGTDMTTSYQNQHGTNLNRMQAYRVSTNPSNPTATPRPTTPPSQSPTATPVPQPGNNSCIITLWSVQYNITSLVNNHSGGNIFNCGTDMTNVYQGRHGTSVSRMQQYRISTAPGTTPQPTSVPSGQSLPPAVAALYPGATIKKQDYEDNGSIEMEIIYNGSCRHIKVNSSGSITSNEQC